VAKKKGNKPLTSHTLDGEDYRRGRWSDSTMRGTFCVRNGSAMRSTSPAAPSRECSEPVVWLKRPWTCVKGASRWILVTNCPSCSNPWRIWVCCAADGHRDQVLRDSVQAIALQWFNNLRFASTRFVHTLWWAQRIVTNRWTLKQAAQEFYHDCSTVINRCEEFMSHEKLKEILTRRLKLKDPQFPPRRQEPYLRQRHVGNLRREKSPPAPADDWDALDEELGTASVKEVGMLLAYAPDEWDLPLEGTVARGTIRQAKPKSQKKAS